MFSSDRAPLLARAPDRLHPHAHPDVLHVALEDQVQEGDVGAVQQDVGGT
jgi:hypothetical protein